MDIDKVQSLDTNIINMNAESLNFWLVKFVEEVCKEDGQRYPSRFLYSIICGLQRHLQEDNASEAIPLINNEDNRYVFSLISLYKYTNRIRLVHDGCA